MKFNFFLLISIFFSFFNLSGQNYWQQRADYKMSVKMDVKTFQYEGSQTINYTNNSPDTLNKVFFHLFFNAFQPGSEMAVRIKSGADKNTRFKIDIDTLNPKDIGKLSVLNLKQNGVLVESELSGTILEVSLNDPIGPNKSTVFSMDFSGQVPYMVRRAGKNSKENVALSMAQWFPKLAEYDYDGWNAEPYLGREFHGVWGSYDVELFIDKKYTVAASGILQNPKEVGHGYSKTKKGKSKKGLLKWHFIANNVHDFTWGADPDYIHDIYPGPNNVDLHFFYKNDKEIIENWKNLQPKTAELMTFFNNTIGPYPYKQYSVVQGGDGGMEYAMLTLITGGRDFDGLLGVTSHELAHSWFQHVLATNEMKHEWMDEGFTSYIATIAKNVVNEENNYFPLERFYVDYIDLALSGKEEPQMTNANRYKYNMGYEYTAYRKGAVFLSQLGYIIGEKNLAKTLKEYYKDFKFKHPTPNDFRRVAERISQIQLKWYLTDWTQTIKTIDYKIKTVENKKNKSNITLERVGEIPMPLDILINFDDGSQEIYYIPIPLMRGEKENPYLIDWSILKDWPWAFPEYTFEINTDKRNISSIIIDPTMLMADVNRENNLYLSEKQ